MKKLILGFLISLCSLVISLLAWEPLFKLNPRLPLVLSLCFSLLISAFLGFIYTRLKTFPDKAFIGKYVQAFIKFQIIFLSCLVLLYSFSLESWKGTLDFSPGEKFSLSQKSKNYFNKMIDQKKVFHLYCVPDFRNKENFCRQKQNLIQLATQNSKGYFRYHTLDFRKEEDKKIFEELKPRALERYVITSSGGWKKELTNLNEESLVSAIAENLDKQVLRVLFMQGHGEPFLDSESQRNYGPIVRLLKSEGYEVLGVEELDSINLSPKTDVLVLGDNTSPYPADNFENKLFDFISKGGGVLAIQNLERQSAPANWLKTWGLQIAKTPIPFQENKTALAKFNPSSPITQWLSTQNTRIPLNRPVTKMELPLNRGLKTLPLFQVENLEGAQSLAGAFKIFSPLHKSLSKTNGAAQTVLVGFGMALNPKASAQEKRRMSVVQMNIFYNIIHHLHSHSAVPILPPKNFEPELLNNVDKAKAFVPFISWSLPILFLFISLACALFHRNRRASFHESL